VRDVRTSAGGSRARAWGDASINPASTISTQFLPFTTKNMGQTESPKTFSKKEEIRTRSTTKSSEEDWPFFFSVHNVLRILAPAGSVWRVAGPAGFEPTTSTRKSASHVNLLFPIMHLSHMISCADGYSMASKECLEVVEPWTSGHH